MRDHSFFSLHMKGMQCTLLTIIDGKPRKNRSSLQCSALGINCIFQRKWQWLMLMISLHIGKKIPGVNR